jgi:hypothetical protein
LLTNQFFVRSLPSAAEAGLILVGLRRGWKPRPQINLYPRFFTSLRRSESRSALPFHAAAVLGTTACRKRNGVVAAMRRNVRVK